MGDTNTVSRSTIHANWDRYVQSPDQLAYSRFSKFPPDSGFRLIDTLGICEGERILEVGCGLGILGSRLLATGRPDTVVGLELNPAYLRASPPSELRSKNSPVTLRGDGFNLPLPANSFDRLLTHTVVNLLNDRERNGLHREARRILTTGGRISHMDGIGGESRQPEHLRPPESERDRRSQFFALLKDVHDRMETGFVDTAKNFPETLEEKNVSSVQVDSYSSTLRLGNPNWSESQVDELLTLRNRADRDRVQRLRNLLAATDELTPEREELLDNVESDLERQSQRRREAFETDRDLGWRSSHTLVINVTC